MPSPRMLSGLLRKATQSSRTHLLPTADIRHFSPYKLAFTNVAERRVIPCGERNPGSR
jgi:hypothetical protein